MQLFLVFLLICFGAGLILWNKVSVSRRVLFLIGIALLISFAYLYLNQL